MALLQSEWDRFITETTSGVAESLYSAGVCCGVYGRHEDLDPDASAEGERE